MIFKYALYKCSKVKNRLLSCGIRPMHVVVIIGNYMVRLPEIQKSVDPTTPSKTIEHKEDDTRSIAYAVLEIPKSNQRTTKAAFKTILLRSW